MTDLILINSGDTELIIRANHIKAIWVDNFVDHAILYVKFGKTIRSFTGTKEEIEELLYTTKKQLDQL